MKIEAEKDQEGAKPNFTLPLQQRTQIYYLNLLHTQCLSPKKILFVRETINLKKNFLYHCACILFSSYLTE